MLWQSAVSFPEIRSGGIRVVRQIICSCSTSSTLDESFRNTLPITMGRGRSFAREGRALQTANRTIRRYLARIQSLADYTIDTPESSFRKRQVADTSRKYSAAGAQRDWNVMASWPTL